MPEPQKKDYQDVDAPAPTQGAGSASADFEDVAAPRMNFAVVNGRYVPVTEDEPEPTTLFSLAKNLIGGVVQNANPLPIIESMYDQAKEHYDAAEEAARKGDYTDVFKENLKASVAPGKAVVGQWVEAHLNQLRKGYEKYQEYKKTGDKKLLSEAFGHALAGALPALTPVMGPEALVVGPMLGEGSEKISQGLETGDYNKAAHGVGEVISPKVAPPLLAGAASGARALLPESVRVPAVAPNRNPVASSAVDFARSEGVPVSAGTATGNPFIAGVEKLSDKSTLGGSIVARSAQAAHDAALEQLGRKLTSADNAPTTPEAAGAAVRDALLAKAERHHGEASGHYDTFRTLEEHPDNLKRVQTGVERDPITGRMQPAYETIPAPVDLKPTQQVLKPIYERWKRVLPAAQQQASPAFHALEQLMSAKRYMRASDVDALLSALKAETRGAGASFRDVSQGIAAKAISQLEQDVANALGDGQVDGAAEALAAGRKATRQKYDVHDVLKKLGAKFDRAAGDLNLSPVDAFNKLTAPFDKNIELLRTLKKQVPELMSEIGRAKVQDILERMTRRGDVERAAGAARDWEKLGPSTKKILFGEELSKKFDKFFEYARLNEETNRGTNSSNTGYVVSIAAQAGTAGALLITNPITGAVYAISNVGLGALVSKMMRNPAVIDALTKGFEVKVGGKGSGTVAQNISAAVGDLAHEVKDSAERLYRSEAGKIDITDTITPRRAEELQRGVTDTERYKKYGYTEADEARFKKAVDAGRKQAGHELAERDNIARNSPYGEGGILPGPLPTELQPMESDSGFLSRIKRLASDESGMAAIRSKPIDPMRAAATRGVAYMLLDYSKTAWRKRMIADGVSPADIPRVRAMAESIMERQLNKAGGELTNLHQLLEKYKAGEADMKWYDDTHAELQKMFGDDADLMAKLLAATSVNATVASNTSLALKAYRYIKAGRDLSTLTPGTGFLPAVVEQLKRIQQGLPINGRKLDNFAKALMGDPDAVVVDRWMLRAFGFKDHVAATAHEYDVIEHTVKELAKANNVTPRQMQAAIWFGQKLAEEGGKARPSSESYEAQLEKRGVNYAKPLASEGFNELIKQIAEPDSGFTYHAVTGEQPTKGFAVSPYKGRELALKASDVKLSDFVDYAIKNWDVLQRPDTYMGGWHNPENGMFYLDVSKVVKTAEEAERIARKAKQLAYFDFQNLKSVPLSEESFHHPEHPLNKDKK